MSKILKRPCPSCGGAMVRGTQLDRIEYRGLSVDVEQPGWYCRCSEVVLSETDLVATNRTYLDLRARADRFDTSV